MGTITPPEWALSRRFLWVVRGIKRPGRGITYCVGDILARGRRVGDTEKDGELASLMIGDEKGLVYLYLSQRVELTCAFPDKWEKMNQMKSP